MTFTGGATHSGPAPTRPAAGRWMAVFAGLVLLSLWVHGAGWFETSVLAPLAVWTARLAGVVLNGLGLEALVAGSSIAIGTRSFAVDSSCTGVLPFFLFTAAVTTSPRPLQAKLWGLFLGGAVLFLINLLRVLLIVLMALRLPDSFWAMHVVAGQILVIAAALGIFVLWARLTEKGSRAGAWTPFLLRRAAGFVLGFGAGYLAYGWFLSSPLGAWTHEAIARAAAWVLGLFSDASYRAGGISSTLSSITLVPGCLASPVVVFLVAVVAALPAAWWKRLLCMVIGFWPLYFLYHLLRVLVVMADLAWTTREASLAYNTFGQYVLLLVGLLLVAWYGTARRNMPVRGVLLSLAWSVPVAIVAAILLGWLFQTGIVPVLTRWAGGSPGISWDPNMALSTMIYFEIFGAVALLSHELGFNRRLFVPLGAALAVLLLVSALILAGVEFFSLKPHPGIIQLLAVALPFALVYGVLLPLFGSHRRQ
ncbi:MAG: archaeosortase/exosortase family protein [Desulfohalobiaceae bacterium]